MIGETLGSYKVLSKLGEGGMGVVYTAEHPLLKKKAVAKLLRPDLSGSEELLERFFNEARAATLIRHPGIVDVFDFGHHETGCAFILMEFLDGESLADRLKAGRTSAEFAVFVGSKIASAVGAAHEHGIVHRDLKPDNVFLVPDRDSPHGVLVKVLDFGIAKLGGEAAGAVETRTGTTLGTPAYMAPEQCRNAKQVDHRADVYAVGCILYEMMCGRPPFLAETLANMITAHLFEAPAPTGAFNPSVPLALEKEILRALAKDPNERHRSMEELSAALTGEEMKAPVAHAALDAPLAKTLPATQQSSGGKGVAMSTTLGASSGQLGAVVAAADPPSEQAGKDRRQRVVYGVSGASVLALGAALIYGLASGDSSPTALVGVQSDAGIASVDGAPTTAVALVSDAAASTVVKLVIKSTPEGARVFRAFDGVEVGVTPYTKPMAPTPGKVAYVLKLADYQEERVEFSTDVDDTQEVALTAIKASGRAATKKRPVSERRIERTSSAVTPSGEASESTTKREASKETSQSERTENTTRASDDGMLTPKFKKKQDK